jgi:hypothetical protein
METDEVKGLVFLTVIMTFTAFIMGGLMERRLKKLDRLLFRIEEDTKYVN